MKILVTGANGYLGAGIVNKILDSGNEVIATDFKTNCIDAIIFAVIALPNHSVLTAFP